MSKNIKYILLVVLLFVLFAILVLASRLLDGSPQIPRIQWATPQAISTMPGCSVSRTAWYTFPIPGTMAVYIP